jgi:hypothetical protein
VDDIKLWFKKLFAHKAQQQSVSKSAIK